ncbi:chorismate mutase [Tuber borchii]|uniref:Chorismate mutase n=1 Tax=Tuber borchii TaxID=42251 RepID=A0A2T6ZSI4_TUBBO|nr:chorismate mutase [Tuber borchii]
MVNKSTHTALDAASVTTMAEVRISIDDLDRQIVTLLGERMRFIEAAARIKPEREAVRDQWRVDDVLTKVGETADKVNFSKKIAQKLYADLIESSILHELVNFDRLAGNNLNGREDDQVEDKKPAKVKAIEKGSAEVETGEVDTWVY